MDDRQTLPQKLYLLGAGRHHTTKALRRANRFKDRVFRIGEIMVRPGRRVDINIEFLVGHFEDIVSKVKTGQLIVQHSADRFVDPDELLAIRAVALGETAPGPIVKLAPEDEPDDDVIDNPEDDGTHEDPATTAPPEEPEPAADEPNPAEEAFGEPEAVEEPQAEPEAVEEPQAEPEAAQDPFDAPEPSYDAPSDLAEPEPAMDAPMDDMGGGEVMEAAPKLAEEAPVDEAVEPAVEERFLPEGFETLTKKELVKLCEERSIEVEASRTNKEQLVRLLTSWKNG